jgi:outer membrane receptor protein involved in Fe transport
VALAAALVFCNGAVALAQSASESGARPEDASSQQIIIQGQRATRLLGLDEQFSVGVVDVLGGEELARVGGGSVAASIVRVPSITIQDGRYVFVRGLGDRYVSTTLNGATLPSTDPSRRSVPLDLFPRNLVQQLAVRKTFTAAMPGESTGGNLLITTRGVPTKKGGSLAVSLGGVGGLTGSNILVDPIRGDLDPLGMDGGARRLSGLLPLISQALNYTDEFSEDTRFDLQRAGGLLIRDGWDTRTSLAGPDVSLAADFGDTLALAGGIGGYFLAANFSSATGQRDGGVSRSFGSAGQLLDDLDFTEFARTVEASGLLELGLRRGANGLAATTLISRITDSTVRRAEGFDGDELLPSVRRSIDWEERQFVSQQVRGDHALGSTKARWQITASQAWLYAPDRREVRFDLRGGDGLYNLIVPSLLRRSDEVVDSNLDASLDLEHAVGAGTLRGGLQFMRRERQSESRSFGLTGGSTLDDNAQSLLVGDVVTVANISGNPADGYAFIDKTLASDGYEANLDVQAAYAEYDRLIGKVQWVAGLRAERYQQVTDTFSLSGDSAAVVSRIDKSSLLPSLSLNWFRDEESQLRLGLAKTVARPDFKETANATFYDAEFDFRVRGNPLLQPSDILNLDLRYEHYGEQGSQASAAIFFKQIDRPIERVVQTASGTAGNSRTFRNADKATVTGIELEGRQRFRLSSRAQRSLLLAFNGSIIRSRVHEVGSPARSLQGQPDYTLNLILGLDDVASGQELTLLINQNGPAIQDVGVNDLPDIVEEPRTSVNLKYRHKFGEEMALTLKLNNLLDRSTRFTQGGKVFQAYSRGISFEAGLDWNY